MSTLKTTSWPSFLTWRRNVLISIYTATGCVIKTKKQNRSSLYANSNLASRSIKPLPCSLYSTIRSTSAICLVARLCWLKSWSMHAEVDLTTAFAEMENELWNWTWGGIFFCYYSSLQLMALKHVSTDDVNDTPPPPKKNPLSLPLPGFDNNQYCSTQ